MRREIDRLVKEKAKEFSIEYDPSHWKAMEVLLDKESHHQKIGVVYWIILGFIMLSLGLFVLLDNNASGEENYRKNKEVAELRDPSSSSQVTIEKIALSELDVHNDQERSDYIFHPVKLNTYLAEPDTDGERFAETKLQDLPSRTQKLDLNQEKGIVTVNEDKVLDRSSFLKESAIKSITTGESSHLNGLVYEKPWKKLWKLGIGWQVENSWGWSTGAFASLGLRLHESISIRFRPGFTLRSDNSMPTESYKQVEYDFGRTDIVGEISKLESYAVDVPLSVQLHKHRHILSLGGGVHYAFMQKVSITERQLSNFTNFTNSRTPFFEDVDQRNAWVQPNESLYPFAELYYSYLLTPSFELGGRSRFYMPEDMNMSNRLNFAAQLVWYIN